MRTQILQLCPLMPAVQDELDRQYQVHRYFNGSHLDPLEVAGQSVRGVVTSGNVGLPQSVAARLPNLEIVAINGVGYDKVDLVEAKRSGYRVTNTPDVLTDDVADLAIGLMLSLHRQICLGDRFVRAGNWSNGELTLGRKASGLRYGIIGLGRIGRAIATRLAGFGNDISYHNRRPTDVPYKYWETPTLLAANCDVLFISALASAETNKLIDQSVIDALGSSGVLVNVGRGALIDEAALVTALVDGRLGGAALDVFSDEPNVPPALMTMDNVVLTPHVASATRETRTAMSDLVLANLAAHFAGAPLPTEVI